ncbi:primosomal protein N' [Candidatus Endobugula sertula]|uniref:Replication restart protein PriA n=1 Tax=Candidatus Endobugula sertula TaxID=62101 RepID=A0A1D2QQD4_9GAMM|nr:primosomal protein N' [Candidatus Endobugula sertula]
MPEYNTLLTVAIPSPLRRLFDYLPNPDMNIQQLRPGMRLSVPFGHQKAVTGILIKVSTQMVAPAAKMRAIHGVIDDIGLDQDILSLCQWCASYYHYPLGEVCHLALPVLLRKNTPAPQLLQTESWQLTKTGKQQTAESFGRAKKQYVLWQLVQKYPCITPDTLKTAGISRTIVNTLINKGILEKITIDSALFNSVPTQPISTSTIALNPEQQEALKRIDIQQFNTYLLNGVTGSGKTEIYLQTIAKVTSTGKQALLLVPEIGLTPQTLERFQQRFNIPVATTHSGMTDRQRFNIWLGARAGQASIIIGTRSAIFTPLPKLGLIIIDEEHDLSYKQQEGVRYSARDIAIIRAQKNNIPIILGSATPSLETLHNALNQRFIHLQLTKRATAAHLPEIRCINQQDASLSPEIVHTIKETLNKQQQVLVFINRRGYAPTLICQECNWLSQCNNCDCRMTVHQFQQHNQHLHCHHCDCKTTVPSRCPHCHSAHLQPLGQGTQRSEEELKQYFTVPILRIDKDSMSRKGELKSALSLVNSGQACILVGTQMLAKGHHFANVSLAVILGFDNSFFSSDFRGAERMGQLLTQVAGRAGREKYQGRVLLHTQFEGHPHLQILLKHGYNHLAQQLLAERQHNHMPPYQYMALIRCHAQQSTIAIGFLQQARLLAHNICPPTHQIQYLGPLPATIEKCNNRYYYYLQIKTKERKQLHFLLTELCWQLEQQRQTKGLHWLVDVDPQEV